MITQSSGEDWVATKVSLSTASPNRGGGPPTLRANHLRVNPMYYGGVVTTIPTIGFSNDIYDRYELSQGRFVEMQEVEEQKVSLHSNQFIQRFDTTRPATIPSDGTEHKVT